MLLYTYKKPWHCDYTTVIPLVVELPFVLRTQKDLRGTVARILNPILGWDKHVAGSDGVTTRSKCLFTRVAELATETVFTRWKETWFSLPGNESRLFGPQPVTSAVLLSQMLPEFGRGLHQQLNAVEAPSGCGVVQSEGAIVASLQRGHLRLPQQPAQHVQTAVSAVKQKEIIT